MLWSLMDLYPLTRRAKSAATSPRKRGEVENSHVSLGGTMDCFAALAMT